MNDLRWIDAISCIWLDANVMLWLDVALCRVLFLENATRWGYSTQCAGGVVRYTDFWEKRLTRHWHNLQTWCWGNQSPLPLWELCKPLTPAWLGGLLAQNQSLDYILGWCFQVRWVVRMVRWPEDNYTCGIRGVWYARRSSNIFNETNTLNYKLDDAYLFSWWRDVERECVHIPIRDKAFDVDEDIVLDHGNGRHGSKE